MAIDFLKTRVSTFDDLISRKGVERGNTILVSGGCGTGKTVFTFQSLFNGALAGEHSLYVSLVEDSDKIKRHMKANFGWDVDSLEAKGFMSIQKIDPFALADDITSMYENEKNLSSPDGGLFIMGGGLSLLDSRKIKIPFKPDRIVIDSISSLEAAFRDKNCYRAYLQAMLDALNKHDSVNFILSEIEQEPDLYSRTGIEEFLVDGVIVLYNLRKGQVRRRALEILKLRCSDHIKEIVPYMIGDEGITIIPHDKVF
ncbi:MAG: ATPase domain-containing protein [Candidatus Altiarchaeota archaeon]